MSNVALAVREAVESSPSSAAVVDGESTYSYRELWIAAGKFAGGLREFDVGTGDAVGISLENGLEFVVALVGTLRNGSIPIVVSPDAEPADRNAVFEGSGAAVVIVRDDAVSSVLGASLGLDAVVHVGGEENLGVPYEEFVDTDGLYDFWETFKREPTDPALAVYGWLRADATAGAEYSHESVAANVRAVRETVPGGLSEGDGQLAAMPAYHPFSLLPVLLSTLVAGGTYRVLRPVTLGATVDALESGSVTVLMLAEPMLAQLAGAGPLAEADLSAVRAVGCLGDRFPTGAREPLRAAGCERCFQLIGQPRTAPALVAAVDDVGDGVLGRELPGCELRVVGPDFGERPPVPADADGVPEGCRGELVVSGPSTATYGRSVDAVTDLDGERWYHTGLRAYRGTDGLLYEAG